MKAFVKQILMLAVIVVIIAVIRHRVPPTLPALPAGSAHGQQQVKINVTKALPETGSESWQLVQLPNKKYQVLVRYKYQIKGKFNVVRMTKDNATGRTYQAAGPVQFGSNQYTAKTIHVNPNGQSGYIVFQKVKGQSVANTAG